MCSINPSGSGVPSSSDSSACSASRGMHVLPLRSASDSRCSAPARPALGVDRPADAAGDLVGDEEADAEHACQLVGRSTTIRCAVGPYSVWIRLTR